jgi:hypothetical protein
MILILYYTINIIFNNDINNNISITSSPLVNMCFVHCDAFFTSFVVGVWKQLLVVLMLVLMLVLVLLIKI